jgi:hypothetical protein
MKKIVDYMIVWGTTQDALTNQVKNNLPEWQPFGGMYSEMFLAECGKQCRLLQVMVKYDE